MSKVKQQQLDSIILNDSIYRQAIINGGCLVGQRPTAPNLSTSKVYGMVDMIYGIAEGTVSAGTIAQITNSVIGVSGYALKLAGVTLTGAGKVKIGFRMEAKNAVKFKNKTASFSCLVLHDVGSTKNYTIYVNKANSADNFSAVTAIENSGAIAVATATGTLIKFEDISLGDCSNGLEIIVECDCGAITTKNFEFTELQFNEGSEVLSFMPKSYEEELGACERYCQVINSLIVEVIAFGTASSTTVAQVLLPFKTSMRIPPVLTATAGDFQLYDGINIGVAVTTIRKSTINNSGGSVFALEAIVASGLTQYRPYFLIFGSAGKLLILSSEL